MGEVINGYNLREPLQNKNAGFCRWTFADKNGMTFFLKEFLAPVFPEGDSLSTVLRRQREEECEQFEKRQRRIYEALGKAADGNLVRVEEFFRCDSHYYIATQKVTGLEWSMMDVQDLSFDDRMLVCKIIAYSMMRLHREGIVHADIKPSNIILKRTSTGKVIAKIIDFDSSFLEADPPQQGDELCGDQVYFAPESILYMYGDDVRLTTKIDVFALGLIFHQFLTGRFPRFDNEEYDSAAEAVLDEQKIEISSELPLQMVLILREMLEPEPGNRPSMDDVYGVFDALDPGTDQEVMDRELFIEDDDIFGEDEETLWIGEDGSTVWNKYKNRSEESYRSDETGGSDGYHYYDSSDSSDGPDKSGGSGSAPPSGGAWFVSAGDL